MARHGVRVDPLPARLLLRSAALLMVLPALAACEGGSGPGSVGRVAEAPGTEHAISAALEPTTAAELREGLAAAVAIDVSGSMNDRVAGEDGRRVRKIEVARRAARELVEQFAAYAEAHPSEPVMIGLYEFSRRRGQPDTRPIVPMGPPDRGKADEALAALQADGGTPIGQAMVNAKHALDATGLSRRHLLIVSDGENTDGFSPEDVAAGLNRRPETERPSIYFVAFDIGADRFNALRDAGGLVLPAANARELQETLDMLITGRILVEK